MVEPEGERIYESYFNKFIDNTKDKSRIIDYFFRTGKNTAFLKTKTIEKLAKIANNLSLLKTEKLLLTRLYILAVDSALKEKTLLALINNAFNRRDWIEFQNYFKEYQSLYPTVKIPLKYRIYLIIYYLNKNDTKKAKQLIELNYFEAQNSEFKNTIEILKLKILINEKNWNKAYSLLNKLTKRKFVKASDKTDILVPGAIVYIQKGKTKQAIRLLNMIIKKIPSQKDWALFQLGKIYYNKGDIKTAQRYWQRLKNTYPKSFWTTQIDFIKKTLP